MKLASAIGALALLFGACGDDDAAPDARIVFDATPTPDADTTPDALVPTSTRNGTIAVTEVKVTNNLAAFGIPLLEGAAVGVGYSDLSTLTVPPVVGSGAIGECTVFVYDLTTDPPQAPPDASDEGPISISGDGAFPNPFPTCAFVAALDEYVCFAVAPGLVGAGNTVDNDLAAGTPVTIVTIPGSNFTSGMVGSHLVLSGFASPLNNGEFAIVQVPDPNVAVVINTNFGGCLATGQCVCSDVDVNGNGDCPELDSVAAGTELRSVVSGAGPVIGGFSTFLDDGTDDIVITKGDSDEVEAITVTIHAAGEGLTLGDTSDLLEALPNTARDVVFNCNSANGVCGPAPDLLTGFALSGETTDGDITNLLPFQMPDAVSSYATFRCTVIGASAVTLTQEAMTAILGTSPTRIQTQVLRVSAAIENNADQLNTTNIVVGHGLVGFTDITPP